MVTVTAVQQRKPIRAKTKNAGKVHPAALIPVPTPISLELLEALQQMDITRIVLPAEARGVTEKRCRHCGSLNVGDWWFDPYTRKVARRFECCDCGRFTELREQ